MKIIIAIAFAALAQTVIYGQAHKGGGTLDLPKHKDEYEERDFYDQEEIERREYELSQQKQITKDLEHRLDHGMDTEEVDRRADELKKQMESERDHDSGLKSDAKSRE